MEWLLKIVEGPMKGAEIALVEGVPVTFGSGDACDVVVRDSSVPTKACEFEVDATGVRIAVGEAAAETLPPFELRSFGLTSFAVGPAESAWPSLARPAAAPEKPSAASAPAPEAPAAERETPPRRRSCLLPFLLLLLLFVIGLILAWFLWPQGRTWVRSFGHRPSATAAVAPKISLADLAKQYGLTLRTVSPRDGEGAVATRAAPPLLSGHLKRRTERLAIRALALAADPTVKLALTDDETLLAASADLLFACTDGALKAVAASNRVVTLEGYAPDAAALEKAIRALDADVKGIARLDTSRVRVGGTPPPSVAATRFVRKHPTESPSAGPGRILPDLPRTRTYPIAGILTAPYPCVVMSNGLRLVEGAQIGTAVLVRIEADKLTLREGKKEIEWRP